MTFQKQSDMSINEILGSGANVQFVINAIDLKEAFLQWSEEKKTTAMERQEETYLSTQEAAKKLSVDASTLWRWDKSGYLKKIKVGNSVRYRESDVMKLMEG